jgi:hypothetical protein
MQRKMKTRESKFYIVSPLSLQEEIAGVVARAVVDDQREGRDIESLPLASLGDFVRGRMGESTRQALGRVHRDLDGLSPEGDCRCLARRARFESRLVESVGET